MISNPIERRYFWAVYSNRDLSEGRGADFILAVSSSKETATRYAVGKYVQGSNGPVRQIELFNVDGCWHLLGSSVGIIEDMPSPMKGGL